MVIHGMEWCYHVYLKLSINLKYPSYLASFWVLRIAIHIDGLCHENDQWMYCIYLYKIWLKIKFLTRCCSVWPGWFILIVFFMFSTFGAEICISSTACLVRMTNKCMENYFGCLLKIWFKLQFLISHGLVGHGCPLGKVLFMLSLVGCWDLHVTMRRTYGCTWRFPEYCHLHLNSLS